MADINPTQFMKINKKLGTLALSALMVVGVAVSVFAAPMANDTAIQQRDPTNTFNQLTWVPLPASPAALTMDTSTNLPTYATYGTGFVFDNVGKTLTVNNVPAANIAGLSTVATSGSYNDLSNKPSSSAPTVYEGTNLRSGDIGYFSHATVASGVAVFQLTSDGTSTGTALFPNGVIPDSISPTVSDATASYQMSWALSNGNKTLTVTTNKLTTSNILTGILGQTAANGAVVKLSAWGY